jgi:glutamyl/glutaminyl-tRNA synthetase
LKDVVEKTEFYFKRPTISLDMLSEGEKAVVPIFKAALSKDPVGSAEPETFVKTVTAQAKAAGLSVKAVYALMRIALTGKAQGLGINELMVLLGQEESYKRFSSLVSE